MTNTKPFFDAARVIAGGKLTQAQVNKLNTIVNDLQPKVMKTSQVGIDLISSFEDLKLNAYDDGVGVWTIGIGTTIYPNGVRVKRGDKCTLEQAKEYFAHDLKHFENAVNTALTVLVNQNQFDALISLTYNIGETAFKESTLLTKLNKGDFAGAAEQFQVWNKGGGKVLKGLIRRREAEKALFLKK